MLYKMTQFFPQWLWYNVQYVIINEYTQDNRHVTPYFNINTAVDFGALDKSSHRNIQDKNAMKEDSPASANSSEYFWMSIRFLINNVFHELFLCSVTKDKFEKWKSWGNPIYSSTDNRLKRHRFQPVAPDQFKWCVIMKMWI